MATWASRHTLQTKQLPNSSGQQLGDVTRLKPDVELKWLKKVGTSPSSRRSSSGCLKETISVDEPPNTKFTDCVLKHNIRIKTRPGLLLFLPPSTEIHDAALPETTDTSLQDEISAHVLKLMMVKK